MHAMQRRRSLAILLVNASTQPSRPLHAHSDAVKQRQGRSVHRSGDGVFALAESLPTPAADDEGNPPPTLCIIDRVAYITDVTNASIAWCNATDNYNGCGVTIQVTFVVANPPQFSYLCTHCIGSQFDYEPILVATEGRLALLAIEVGQFSSHRGRDHYIYHAGDASRGVRVQTSPQPSRDVAVIDRGRRLKYVQLHLQVTMHRLGGVWGRVVPSYDDWKAARWSMDTARPSSGWRQDSEVVHGSEVGSTIDPALLEPPPYEFDVDKGLPLPQIFEKHYTSLPVISLHDDGKDVVYFMAKVNYHKPALVTAVDMSNKTAQQATQFLPGKLMETAFVHSRISRFLSMAPASRLGYYKRKLESTSNGMDVPMNDTLMM
ncbi:hypothetical protein ZWY2020_028710 [Hordeum vulgare]|nr:hypothetical protein ZWY2020_028710 [Hordeum vulgare]